MAATLVNRTRRSEGGLYREDIELSGLTAGAIESIAHKGPASLAASAFRMYVKTSATSADPVFLTYTGTDTTNNEVDYRFDTVGGGDLAGAVVVLTCEWQQAARQDRQSIAADNNT